VRRMKRILAGVVVLVLAVHHGGEARADPIAVGNAAHFEGFPDAILNTIEAATFASLEEPLALGVSRTVDEALPAHPVPESGTLALFLVAGAGSLVLRRQGRSRSTCA